MGAAGNGLDRLADRAPIFDDWLVPGNVAHGDFMTEGDVVEQLNAARPFAFESHRADARALFQIGDRDTDVVLGFVEKDTMFHIQNNREWVATSNLFRADPLKVPAVVGNSFLGLTAREFLISIPK